MSIKRIAVAGTPEVSVAAGLAALKKLYPNGEGRVLGQTEGEFEYQFVQDGLTVDAVIRVGVHTYRGTAKGLSYRFSYYKFGVPGSSSRMFNPQADSGPYMDADLKGLGAELKVWEKYVAEGLRRKLKISLSSVIEMAANLEDLKKPLLAKINRAIGQLGTPSSRKNVPRQLNQFEKKKRSALRSIYYKVDAAKDATTLKSLDQQLAELMKPIRH